MGFYKINWISVRSLNCLLVLEYMVWLYLGLCTGEEIKH